MRVAALADVHGNAIALEAVLAELERAQPDLIVSCGDLTWGPLPLETVALLEPWRERLLCVRGNSERELVERKLIDSEIAVWEHEQHDGAALSEYLGRTQPSVTVEVEGLGATLFCHGSPRSDEECVTVETPDERVAEFTAGVEAACIVTAHTHMQYDRTLSSGLRVVNPGSVGSPCEGARGAYWALLGPGVEFRRTPYDVEGAAAAIEVLGVPVDARMLEQLLDPPDSESTTEYFESLRGA